MKLSCAIFIVCTGFGFFSATELWAVKPNCANKGCNVQATAFTSDKLSITANDKVGMLLMREEEKLAGDIYALFYEKYGLVPFFNINKSEISHTTAVLQLLNYFGLPDPALSLPGEFSNETIRQLYSSLSAKGTTVESALETAAYIEEYDIADLQKLMNETQNADIKQVYESLLYASYNHLRAFNRNLTNRDINYMPRILDAGDFKQIIEN